MNLVHLYFMCFGLKNKVLASIILLLCGDCEVILAVDSNRVYNKIRYRGLSFEPVKQNSSGCRNR